MRAASGLLHQRALRPEADERHSQYELIENS